MDDFFEGMTNGFCVQDYESSIFGEGSTVSSSACVESKAVLVAALDHGVVNWQARSTSPL